MPKQSLVAENVKILHDSSTNFEVGYVLFYNIFTGSLSRIVSFSGILVVGHKDLERRNQI